MVKQYFENLDETLFSRRLSNGLQVLVVPKPGFSKKYAYFVTDYGAIHREFSLEGQHYTTPAGVAHYLEHKLFDLPDRDVAGEFAAMGAGVNAFTSFDMTAYYFSCTEHFDRCLRLLLEFVSTPYFTAESVEKEQGIIGQEIDMYLDEPGSQVFENLMKAMYKVHPIREPILGTRESIARITPEILELCHRAFYAPGNMVLCVVGDVEPEAVCRAAEEVLGTQHRPVAVKTPFAPEPEAACTPLVREKAEIPMPMFSLGFSCPDPGMGEEAFFREIVGDLAAETLFGEASALYLQLYEQGIIDSSFSGGFDASDGCAQLNCSGDSYEPEAVREAIFRHAETICREGVEKSALQRLKRSAMGRRIRDLDSFDSICFRLCACQMTGFPYFEFPRIYDRVEPEDIVKFLQETVLESKCSLSVLEPIKEANYES